jgi:hypothetical protein
MKDAVWGKQLCSVLLALRVAKHGQRTDATFFLYDV